MRQSQIGACPDGQSCSSVVPRLKEPWFSTRDPWNQFRKKKQKRWWAASRRLQFVHLAREEFRTQKHRFQSCRGGSRMYAIKVEITDPKASTFVFSNQKTMYGGKRIARGDSIFIVASENEGGSGLIALGTVTSAKALPRKPGLARQTPRVSITVRRDALAKRPLGRRELKPFSNRKDGRPETELNFKFYRQATNKIVGLTPETAKFLRRFF